MVSLTYGAPFHAIVAAECVLWRRAQQAKASSFVNYISEAKELAAMGL